SSLKSGVMSAGLVLLGAALATIVLLSGITPLGSFTKRKKLAQIAGLQAEAFAISDKVRGEGISPGRRAQVSLNIAALSNRVYELCSRLNQKQAILDGYEGQLKALVGQVHWLEQMLDYHA